jgi:hypothetical protein
MNVRSLVPLAAATLAGCFGSVGRGARINHASPLPVLSESQQDGDYADAAALAVQEVGKDEWGALDRSGKYLCRRGAAHDAAVLKEVNDALGKANLFFDRAVTDVRALPLGASDDEVNNVTLACDDQEVVLGVNGKGLSLDWIVAAVGNPMLIDSQVFFHFLGASQATGDLLWIYVLIDKGSWKATSSSYVAVNVKRYVDAPPAGVYHMITTNAHYQGEFFLAKDDTSGIYLEFDGYRDGDPKVGRYRVAGP